MVVTYKKEMEATLGPPGMKMVAYELYNIGTYNALTIDAKSIGLSSIYSMQANLKTLDTAIAVEYTIAIGTFSPGRGDANYATVRGHVPGGTTDVDLGTMEIFAIGM